MKTTLEVLIAVMLFFVAFGLYFTTRLMYIKRKDPQYILERELKEGRFTLEDFEALSKREILISSPFGYKLKAILVEPFQSSRYIIFAHGVTENKINSIKYMNLFIKRGFNAVIYDQRRHGESGGKTTSYGYYEKFDLKAVVDWLKKAKGPELLLGIHGESMGAATLLLYGGILEDGADFYIADCPFSNFKTQLGYRLKKETRLPSSPFIPIGDWFLRFRDKYSIEDVSPISVIHRIQHPVLFIHSQKDDYVLPSMTEALFTQKKGPKMLYLAKRGSHAQSLNENREEYEKAIDEFLNKFHFNL